MIEPRPSALVTVEEFLTRERARLDAFGAEMAETARKLGRVPTLPEGQWRLALNGEAFLQALGPLDLEDED